MHLQKLALLNYKNYEEANLDFDPGVNLFIGKNGSGKTNLLDAIYYLSFTKSAFSTSDQQCIRYNQNSFMVKGLFEKTEKKFEVAAGVQLGAKKTFRENQVEYDKLSDHIGKYPAVLIAPDDTDLIREGSEVRRKFFDGIISQLDRKYLEDLLQYNNVLKQRNALLKMFFESGRLDEHALESYDRLLVKFGQYIYECRARFVKIFLPEFEKYFSIIVEEQENPGLNYLSGLNETNYQDGLAQCLQKDRILQRTNFGIHRDDFEFLLKGSDVKRSGSQGQQKSYAIALKLAQYAILEQSKGFRPILLLDDIFDKLDDFRISALIQLIKSQLGQVFLTDARPHRTIEILNNIGVHSRRFKVENGIVIQS
jgi:DNA replication and repair protein RecF